MYISRFTMKGPDISREPDSLYSFGIKGRKGWFRHGTIHFCKGQTLGKDTLIKHINYDEQHTIALCLHNHRYRRQPRKMAPQSRGHTSKPTFQGFILPTEPTSPEDEGTPTVIGSSHQLRDDDEHMQDVNDAILEAQYSRDASVEDTLEDTQSSGSSQSGSEEEMDSQDQSRPYLHHSNSSFSMANAFAPPFYNRPPTPLPPSPYLPSLLRPPFSPGPSRPTTPDSSDNDTPNDTESAVAKSARIATMVPRASPKVPTYEYYGFVLYITSTLGFCGSSQLTPAVLS